MTSNNLEVEERWLNERSGTPHVCLYDLFDGGTQGVMQAESGVVGFDFRQVAVVANMISDPVVIQILVLLRDS